MQIESMLMQWLGQLGARLPLLIVGLVGLVLALSWRRRAPRAARLAVAGSIVVLLTEVLSVVWSVVGVRLVIERLNFDRVPMGLIFTAVQFVFAVVFAGGIGLLLAAAFADRSGRPVRPDEDDEFRAPRARPGDEGITAGRPPG
jgi:MFS superfamily sulfate permease-like transporter